MATNKRNISDFLSKEYKDYASYVISGRAIPSICDGLKPGARKAIHAALVGSLKDSKLYKLLVLSGDTMRLSQYAHGDASLNGTITGLAQEYHNNLVPFQGEGQFGSLRDPDSVGSPRYLYIKLSKYMNLIYKTDYDLLEFVFDDGQYVEPTHYLPIIPTVLTNMAEGIAVGYAFHTMAYNPIDIIDACIEELNGSGKFVQIKPYLKDVPKSQWNLQEDGSYLAIGSWKLNKSKDIMTVTDIPYDMSFESFEKLLNKQIDAGYIKDWKNYSSGPDIHYDLIFFKGQLEKECKKDRSGNRIANMFKLIKKVPNDLLWLLDENNKLKYFESRYAVVRYFVNWRLKLYTDRKKKLVKILEEKYKDNSDLVKFIELVCKGKLKIRNRSKKDITDDMREYRLPYSLVPSTPMSKVTIEERDALIRENEEIKKELEYIKNTSEKQMYLNDLELLRKEIEKDFK